MEKKISRCVITVQKKHQQENYDEKCIRKKTKYKLNKHAKGDCLELGDVDIIYSFSLVVLNLSKVLSFLSART